MTGARAQAGKLRILALGTVLLLAIGSAGLRAPFDDGFPLSTYPMFAAERGAEGVVTVATATAEGQAPRPIPPRYVGSGETMQALQTLRKTARAGRRASMALCRDIASRIHTARDPAFAGYGHVEIVTERVATIAFLAGQAKPTRMRLHAACRLEAGP